ncbi:hypothetical protein SO802_028133 [Lithocarpus litseifolius]|uniref:Disease resistance protein At1g50180 n=1 Tax=Lithocarpus litseifolius TaxID=425828 RepID=A0AAW2BPG2_9ROSI
MAVSVVSGVVTRLSNLLLQEAIYLIDVSDKAHELQTELIRMQFFLKDADARQNESAFIKNSVAEMKDLAYDAEDVIATYALTVASRKGRGIQKVLKRCACILFEGITVHQVGSKIDAIKTRISNLKQSFQEYGIIRESTIQAGGPSSLNEPQPEQRKTYPYLEDDPVGFNDDLGKLVEILLKEEEGNTRVASICGMGGLGKTTLARMVYNDPRVKQYFNGGCAWVCISQQCQKFRPVWEEIMINLLPKENSQNDQKEKSQNDQKEEIKGWSDGDLIRELREVQQKQKCLVVLDDIWKIEDWNILCQVFPMKDTKSKILLTSRNTNVALKADPRGIHNLEGLNPEKSFELLEKMAISWRSDSETKTYMKKLGKEMIEYCGRLPLAITVLGGLLATKQTREGWDDVHKHVKSYLYEEQNLQVNKVLALSYNDLPSHLKPCFLYLGHFPEDFEIPTKELIRMWHRGGREDTMDDVGDRYLRELVQRCMVLVGKEGSLGRIKTCRMHDLMRDFCVSKAQDEDFLHFTNTFSMKQCEAQIGKVRRLAIISKSEYPQKYRVSGKLELANISYLQTLVNFQPKTIQIPTWFELNRLRVLKVWNDEWAQGAMQMLISRCPLVEKLNLIDHMKKLPEAHHFSPNLAKLTLQWTCLEEDPMPTLEKLPNLKILRLFYASFVGKDMVCSKERFPLLQYLLLKRLYDLEEWRVEEGAMPSLCHLIIDSCYKLKTIPDGLRFVTTLQELKVDDEDRLHEVKHVPSLVFENCDRE